MFVRAGVIPVLGFPAGPSFKRIPYFNILINIIIFTLLLYDTFYALCDAYVLIGVKRSNIIIIFTYYREKEKGK